MKAVEYKIIRPANCGKKYRTTRYAKVKDSNGKEWPKAIAIQNLVKTRKTYPNEPCPCGKRNPKSNWPMKFKHCCKTF